MHSFSIVFVLSATVLVLVLRLVLSLSEAVLVLVLERTLMNETVFEHGRPRARSNFD
jgi:hypothetical protein